MRKSIFFKNFMVTAIMFVVCFLIFGIAMILTGRAFLIREKQDGLHATVTEVSHYAEAVRFQGGIYSWDLRMNMTAIAQSTGNHILLCDGKGMVVSSSDFSPISPYFGKQLDASVLQTIGTVGYYESVSDLSGIYDGLYYVVGEPVEGWNGRIEGYVFVGYAISGVLHAWRDFIALFLLIAVGVLTAAVGVAYVNSRHLARPLYEMSAAAHRFAHGDYSARVQPTGQEDEVGTLIDAFNGMAEAIEQTESLRREFVANVSHELRTPMTTIAGFADGILDGTIPPEEEKKYLESISSETKRLSRLVRSMLDMSRLRDGDPESRQGQFDLSEMVVQTILNFEERVDKKRLDMELDMPEDPVLVKGDVDALTRVVYNLMDNAVKFSREGGRLSVSLWKENGRAAVSIQDEGEGIPPEELPRIFDRFHKADEARSQDRDGVGLGLYMVREILAAHDQDIFVTSEDGVTTFTFTLALAERD